MRRRRVVAGAPSLRHERHETTGHGRTSRRLRHGVPCHGRRPGICPRTSQKKTKFHFLKINFNLRLNSAKLSRDWSVRCRRASVASVASIWCRDCVTASATSSTASFSGGRTRPTIRPGFGSSTCWTKASNRWPSPGPSISCPFSGFPAIRTFYFSLSSGSFEFWFCSGGRAKVLAQLSEDHVVHP